MKCWLEACHFSVFWNGRHLMTAWASQTESSLLVSLHQWHQALSAQNKHMLVNRPAVLAPPPLIPPSGDANTHTRNSSFY